MKFIACSKFTIIGGLIYHVYDGSFCGGGGLRLSYSCMAYERMLDYLQKEMSLHLAQRSQKTAELGFFCCNQLNLGHIFA